MSEELTITKERVLKAAEQCEDAKEVLETLFPEAFEGKGGEEIPLRNLEIARIPGGSELVVKDKRETTWLFRLIRPEHYVVSGISLTTEHMKDGDVIHAIRRY